MNTSDNLKHFEDPLLAGLNNEKTEKKKTGTRHTTETTKQGGGNHTFILGIVLLIAVCSLGYFIYQAQQRIEGLSSELAASQSQLSEVSATLDESNTQITELNEGLVTSEQKIQVQSKELNRYKGLYSEMKSEQEVQTKELEALNVQKANQTEVNQLKGETSQLKSDLQQTNTSVSELDSRTAQNQQQIEQTRTDMTAQISTVRQTVGANTNEIDAVKRSLEREYYNFELHEKSGYMKVFNVALSLQDTDIRKREFDVYVLADGKVIRKKDQAVNEPILFYVEGQKKPYEVVVTRVAEKLAVGYLSIPKG